MDLPGRIYLTTHLSIIRDEHEIVDYLIDHNEMPANYDANHVTTFYVGPDLHLVIYYSEESDRGFQMYVVEDFSVNVKELVLLRDMFARMVREYEQNSIFRKAHYQLDSIALMAKTLRAAIHNDLDRTDED